MAMCKCGKCAACKARAKTAAPKGKNANLAAMYGDKKKITRGDVITAAKKGKK
ncbi:hypothetical protein UFOVP221_95 [uncultured Caudovirales phage]|uniref:Uncharacterized protein n=1 Tax=uncultured Caudovirales phage TaxID=2100421 RepID=A0A6J7WS74_9CAUD|nr:hypothetical protein UFOVP221_95 [uncultured Caudovirales phage]